MKDGTEPIRLVVDGAVAIITLDVPPLNLTTLAATRALDAALQRIDIDPEIRVVVLTAAGTKAFSAGSDLKEFDRLAEKVEAEDAAFGRLARCPKPTIAALNASAFGGGAELAVCCDVVVAEEGSMIGFPEIKLGIFPGSGGTVRVTRRIGPSRTKQLMLWGNAISTEVALAWGLVDRLAPKGGALRLAAQMAAELAQLSGPALLACKAAINGQEDLTEEAALSRSKALVSTLFKTADVAEGANAFLAKRRPIFQQR